MEIKQEQLNKELHFPKIQAVLIKKEKNVFKKTKNFSLFLRHYKVIEDYIVWCDFLKRYIFIPKDFEFDGASVPKILNNLYGTTGILFYGALPHDFLYRYNGVFLIEDHGSEIYFEKFNKKQADNIFKDLCFQESGMKFGSSVATFALTLFGFFNWNLHRKNNLGLEWDYPHLFFRKNNE